MRLLALLLGFYERFFRRRGDFSRGFSGGLLASPFSRKTSWGGIPKSFQKKGFKGEPLLLWEPMVGVFLKQLYRQWLRATQMGMWYYKGGQQHKGGY